MRLAPRGTRTSELRRIRQREEPQKRWYEGLEPASGQGPVRYGPTGRWRRNEGWRTVRAAPAARRPLLYFINRAEHDGARESRQRAWAGYGGTVGEESTRNVGVHYVVLPTSTSMNKSPSRWFIFPRTSRHSASATSSAGSSGTKARANVQAAELVGRLHDQLAAAEEASLGASAPPVV